MVFQSLEEKANASQGAMITSIDYLPICLGRIMPEKSRISLFTII